MIAVLLLAAGASTRMRGHDKLLEPVDGMPLLRRMATEALTAGCGPVLVTLPPPPGDAARRDVLQGLPLTLIAVADAAEGMAASIRAGVAALPAHCDAVMILPADMPDLDAGDLERMADAYAEAAPGSILRAGSEDRPGHPVIFPAQVFADLKHICGDQGARPVVAAHTSRVIMVPLPGAKAVTDLDTPEAWAEWRSRDPLR